MAREVGIPNDLLKAILALMSAGDGDDMAPLWGNARIAFEGAIADERRIAADNDASYCIMRDEVERLRPRLRDAELRASEMETALREIGDEATNAYNWHCTRGMKVAKTPRLAPGIASWLKKLTDAALKR